jgi:hypothetical protein
MFERHPPQSTALTGKGLNQRLQRCLHFYICGMRDMIIQHHTLGLSTKCRYISSVFYSTSGLAAKMGSFIECKHLLSRMLVTNPSARATLQELMVRGLRSILSIPLRLRADDLDRQVIRGMKGFEFGTDFGRHRMKTLESAREGCIRAGNKNGNGSNCSRSPFRWVEYFSNSSLAAPSTARMTPTPKNQDVFQVSIITHAPLTSSSFSAQFSPSSGSSFVFRFQSKKM